MAISRININPVILSWAVERFGGNPMEYAEENEKFSSWMTGVAKPTLNELMSFAKKFYVPLGFMFLQTPPEERDSIPLFRRIADRKIGLNIKAEISALTDRQDWLSSYLRSENFDKLDYVGIFDENSDVKVISRKISETLHLPVNWAFECNTVEKALNYLTQIIEDKGTIVCFNSVVGFNNNRHISVADCRGFALVNDYAPFVFVNSKDAKSAQVFTLIHEFAHILTGYSAGIGEENLTNTTATERLCDKVAAEFLVNENLFREEWTRTNGNFEILSKKFKVSRFVILRRAKELKFIDDRQFGTLYKKWKAEPIVEKSESQGGQFYYSAIKKCSRTFLIHLDNALSSFKILNTDAYRLAGMKGDTFYNITKKIK